MARHSDTIRMLLADTPVCFFFGRGIQAHLKYSHVIAAGCEAISALALSLPLREKLGISGTCDVLVKGIARHPTSLEVAEQVR
jgi:hypothetical protein